MRHIIPALLLLPILAFTCSPRELTNGIANPAAIKVVHTRPKIHRMVAVDTPKVIVEKPEPVSGRKIKVMVVDTGVAPHYMIKPYLPEEFGTNKQDYPTDNSFCIGKDFCSHGTHIAGVILFGDQNKKVDPVCGEVELYSCNFYNDKDVLSSTVRCFERALRMDVDFINYSAGGAGTTLEEHSALKILSNHGVKVIVAAGNEQSSFESKPYYPALYSEDPDFDNLIPVANMEYDGVKAITSNYAGGIVFDYGTDIKSTIGVDGFGYQTGTSQAAAMYTHRLVMKRCKQIHNVTDELKKLSGH